LCETPLHEGHLELMLKVTRIGGIIVPPIPPFYHLPETIMDIVDQTIVKALDLFFNRCKIVQQIGYRRKIIFDAVPKKPTGKIEKPKLREKYIGK